MRLFWGQFNCMRWVAFICTHNKRIRWISLPARHAKLSLLALPSPLLYAYDNFPLGRIFRVQCNTAWWKEAFGCQAILPKIRPGKCARRRTLCAELLVSMSIQQGQEESLNSYRCRTRTIVTSTLSLAAHSPILGLRWHSPQPHSDSNNVHLSRICVSLSLSLGFEAPCQRRLLAHYPPDLWAEPEFGVRYIRSRRPRRVFSPRTRAI